MDRVWILLLKRGWNRILLCNVIKDEFYHFEEKLAKIIQIFLFKRSDSDWCNYSVSTIILILGIKVPVYLPFYKTLAAWRIFT
jgi:hypothetical protein